MWYVHAASHAELQYDSAKTAHKARQWVVVAEAGVLLLWQDLLVKCVQHTDFKTMPCQVLCLAADLTFTQQAEQAIRTGTLPQLQVRAGDLSTCAACTNTMHTYMNPNTSHASTKVYRFQPNNFMIHTYLRFNPHTTVLQQR